MRLVDWLAPLAWMGLILALAGDSGSADTTGRLLLPLLQWLLPGLAPDQLEAAHWLARKLGHVVEYALLAALWYRALQRRTALSPQAATRAALGIALGWAVLDEGLQVAAPNRTGSAADVALDGAAAVLALLVLRAAWRRRA